MIIVSMGAGLGNQMFEYAFYMHLKKLFPDKIIKVDTKYAFPVAHNGIEVFDIFRLHAEEADVNEVRKLTKGYLLNGEGFNANSLFQKIRRKISGCPCSMKIQSDFTQFDPLFLTSVDQDLYYYGPFANYHYFKDIEQEVRKVYKFPHIKDESNKLYKKQIEASNSVSIHVRKGDYVKEGIKLTSREFYINAINLLEDKEKNLKFFVFTDDTDYARTLFPNDERFVYVEGNVGKNSYRDMQLMSLCKHNITANSTFSFWGAFLNENVNKLVVAPNLPFTGGKVPFVCDEWILL